jgi:predicted nucleic acid-binding protein
MTSLCFAEALGVLKRKMARKELSREQYFGACYLLIAHLTGAPLRLHLDDTININLETFTEAETLAQKHELDLSDALQIITVKHGKFKKWANESKTVLATADGDLEKAAEKEDLRAWNVEKISKPPGS